MPLLLHQASSRSANGDLSLTIEFVTAKEAQLSGMMQPHLLPQAKLEFRLDRAAASLGRTVQDLEDVIREFGGLNPGTLPKMAVDILSITDSTS